MKKSVDPRKWKIPGQARYESAGLAKWILKPKPFLELGFSWQRPKLPFGLGCCNVLVVNKRKMEFLRPAFILPLKWKNDAAGHQDHLPKGLVAVAEDVKAYLKKNPGRHAPEEFDAWTLHFSVEKAPNLSEFSSEKGDWSSAWVPLFAGLWLAVKDLLPQTHPQPQILATGAWENGLQAITGLDVKAAVAQEFGASELFYPEGSQPIPDSSQSNDGSFKLTSISRTESPKASVCLRHLLSTMAQEPVIPDNPELDPKLDEKLDTYYQLRFQSNKNSAREFYCQVLSPRIVEKNQKSGVRISPPGTLITWVSTGWELILNDLLLFKPKHLVLLTSGDFADKPFADKTTKTTPMSKIKSWCEEQGISLERISFENNPEPEVLFTKLQADLQDLNLPTPWSIDITQGNVLMSLALYGLFSEDCRHYYWHKQMNPEILPSTSRLIEVYSLLKKK